MRVRIKDPQFHSCVLGASNSISLSLSSLTCKGRMALGESMHKAELQMKRAEKALDSGPSMETGVGDREKCTLSPTCFLRTVASGWRPRPQSRAREEKQRSLQQGRSEPLT